MTSPWSTDLDSAIFNQDLFTSLLAYWLPSFPQPSQECRESDLLKWFAGGAEVDKRCLSIAGDAIRALGPASMPLPVFKGAEEDQKVLVQPFLSLLDDEHCSGAHAPRLPPVETAIALLILLDQMPRNIFRGEEQSIVYTHYDRIAYAVAVHVYGRGLDHDPAIISFPAWRYWLYMPLGHSESIEAHAHLRTELDGMLSLAINRQDEMGIMFIKRNIDAEDKHVVPLKTFGRYPWRNRWLGRKATEEEERWLRDGGDTFGTTG